MKLERQPDLTRHKRMKYKGEKCATEEWILRLMNDYTAESYSNLLPSSLCPPLPLIILYCRTHFRQHDWVAILQLMESLDD